MRLKIESGQQASYMLRLALRKAGVSDVKIYQPSRKTNCWTLHINISDLIIVNLAKELGVGGEF